VTARPPTAAPHRELLLGARRALEQLAAAEREYLDRNPYRLVHQYDPRAGSYMVHVQVAAAVPDAVPALAGTVVREARASLDALAAALVPAPPARPVRFPIHDSLPEFAQRSRRAIAAMPDAAQATIEEVQPYHTFGGYHKDALWLLRELGTEPPSLAAGALRDDSELGVNTKRHVEIVGELRVRAGAFDDGAVVVEVAAKVTGQDPKLDLYLRPSFELAFVRDGPGRGAPLVGSLATIADRVEQVIAALEPDVRG
jgi:hypothetical protein